MLVHNLDDFRSISDFSKGIDSKDYGISFYMLATATIFSTLYIPTALFYALDAVVYLLSPQPRYHKLPSGQTQKHMSVQSYEAKPPIIISCSLCTEDGLESTQAVVSESSPDEAESVGQGNVRFIGFGSLATSILAGELPGLDAKLAWALAFGITIHMGALISGCNMDPAISFMFFLMRHMTFIQFVVYSLAQTLGCFLGAALTFGVYYDAINNFDNGTRQVLGPQGTAGIFTSFPQPYLSIAGAIIDQIATTSLLCISVRAIIDKRTKVAESMQPLLIGFCVYFIVASYSYNGGGSMNPARDFGPRLFLLVAGYPKDVISHNDYKWFWIPIIGPFIGAAFSTYFYDLAIGMHLPELEPDDPSRKRRTTMDPMDWQS
ncbi:hypothetical protein FO519_006510 [Halicephalobus sp. NKZ332]|nr:hypothetical protein FO519_006510 [Halicephalobus sp. NKZ332]